MLATRNTFLPEAVGVADRRRLNPTEVAYFRTSVISLTVVTASCLLASCATDLLKDTEP